MNTVGTFVKGQAVLKIYQDDMAESPRECFEHLGTMACWHSRYMLGDKHDFSEPSDFEEFRKKNPMIKIGRAHV